MYTGYSGAEFTDLLVKMLGLAVNPSRLNNILDISELVRDTIIERNKDKAEEIIYNSIPGLEELFQASYNPVHILEELIKMPANTLGYLYAEHMYRNNLKFFPVKSHKEQNIHNFFFKRIRETHDIIHVITGFNTDNLGEIGIEGFYLGQAMLPNLYCLMIARMSHILFDDKIFDGQLYLQVLTKGFQMGQTAEKVLGLKWEDMWLEDLENLRNKLRIIC
ncbi:Coq4 family protein [Kamptonema animale CS-326]|jgi:ubiquinone biosynthesis protein COQ4|uniref:Coq4 family protein n=1 Tax=Kamptonema animale TaxID=92934 RepID=UPI002330B1AD|nr:Coq4 family protein [Kamptonema animale]MDB9509860.1 Coq4 family protein [Kamptonema animale CS-326]